MELDILRRFFAESLAITAPVVNNRSIIDAFARVPRERFLGPGPWQVRSAAAGPDGIDIETPDDHPRHIYHDVVVSIDRARGLDSGGPSLWARCFDHLEIEAGERILHVGAGTGYYSAILAELVGPAGSVQAVELVPELAERARAALSTTPQAQTIVGDGRFYDAGDVDLIVASAGMTHPPALWLDRLAMGGRLIFPLTADWHGFFLKVTRTETRFVAEAVRRVSIFPCVGGQEAKAGARLRRALARERGVLPHLRALHRDVPPPEEAFRCWYTGPGFSLSSERPILVEDAAFSDAAEPRPFWSSYGN